MNSMPKPILEMIVFIFGLMVGSFLNVCIWRLPREEQVVQGRSRCRSCGKLIRWFDNIPLASFAILKGKCRNCKSPISAVYPAVELAAGLLFLGVVRSFGFSVLAVIHMIFGASLLLLSVIDAQQMILPDEVTLPGLQLGVVVSFFYPALHGQMNRWAGLWQAVFGALVGAGLIMVMNQVGRWIFRTKLARLGEEEAVGFGDVKLMAMVGAFIGWKKTLLVILLLGPLFGSLVGLVLKYRFGRDLIPYGPFLAIGTMVAVFWGEALINWYRCVLWIR